jgi:hypothetical protein
MNEEVKSLNSILTKNEQSINEIVANVNEITATFETALGSKDKEIGEELCLCG